MSSARLQDTKSIYKNHLNFYTPAMKNPKVKIRKQSHGCAQSRGLKKWLVCLQHTQQELGFTVTRGTKLVACLWTNTQYVSLCTFTWLPGRTSGTGLSTGRKPTVFSGGVCHLEPVWSMHGWAMSGLMVFKEKRKIDSNYMPFWKRQNNGDNKKINGCQEFGGRGEMNTQSTEVFMSGENTLYDIIMILCHHTFVQTHRTCNTIHFIIVNPKMN